MTDILAGGGRHDWDFTYDDADNRRFAGNGDASLEVEIDYDAANRPDARRDRIDGELFTTGYTYDGRDNLATVTYPSGRAVTYSYDNADRVTHVAQSGQVWATSFGYHATGALAAYTSGNGQTTAITYDPRQRPDQLTSGPLSLDYDYDDVGNVASITDARAGFSQGFAYDPLDRLTAVTGFGAATYTYDARGNRTSRNSVTYSYDGGTDRLISDGVSSFTYDGVGNLATTGTQTYTYTPFNLACPP